MSYPYWWNKTITLYNRFEDSTGRITWYRHNIKGCFVKQAINIVYSGNSDTECYKNIARLRKSKNFLLPYQWKDSEDKESKFTIQTDDIVVFADVSDTIDEYTCGKRSNDLLTKYKGQCTTVKVYQINDVGDMPHYRIEGD